MSDEQNCNNGTICNIEKQFTCGSGECIDWSKACNKQNDCEDGSDEIECGINQCSDMRENQCGQNCINLPIGYRCTCNSGYTLMADKRACRDIDECKEVPGACDQYCYNTVGSFICKCNTTFYASTADGKTCKRKDNLEPWLIFSNRYYIRNLTTDGKNLRMVKSELRNAVALDFDIEAGRLYYADVESRRIFRVNVSNPNATTEVLVRHQVNGLEGLAIDWIGKKMYWIDRVVKEVTVAELNGINRKSLLRSGLSEPRSISVHPGVG